MTNSAIGIASMALGMVRSEAITSFEDDSEEARVVSLYYETEVLDLLSRLAWPFARTKRRLGLSPLTPVNEYRHAHIVPAGTLQVRAVFEDDFDSPTDRFRVQILADGKKYVLSNSENITADLIVRVPEQRWTAPFVKLVVLSLAARIAIPLTDDRALSAQLEQLAFGTPSEGGRGGQFRIAATNSINQNALNQIDLGEHIDARFGGLSGGTDGCWFD